MNKSNHEQSNESIRELIETVTVKTVRVKKQQELDPTPTQQDYEDVTALILELFTKNKKSCYSKDDLISFLKGNFCQQFWREFYSKENKTSDNPTKILNRIGMEGMDAILSVLKEKQILNEFDPKYLMIDRHGNIVLVENYESNNQIGRKLRPIRIIWIFLSRLFGFFARFFFTSAFTPDLPVYRYANRDVLYSKKILNFTKRFPE